MPDSQGHSELIRLVQMPLLSATLDQKISWWINHRLNIRFRGQHGVGKTAIVQQAFERAGLRWRRFSVPSCKPKQIFENSSVEALFFDDLERMPKRFRSLILDLVRDGTERLPILKIIWAAVSVPEDDDDFDLEQFDPAWADHFDVTVQIPFKPHLPYFTEVFGEQIAHEAVAWWDGLPDEKRNQISPRALEATLSYARSSPSSQPGTLELVASQLSPR